MNLVFISLIACTVIQRIVCGGSLALLLSYIGRILFLTRLIGAVVPIKVTTGFEIGHLFFVGLGVIFTGGGGTDWPHVLLTVLFCGLTCLLYWIDNTFYLYVVEDEKEEDI